MKQNLFVFFLVVVMYVVGVLTGWSIIKKNTDSESKVYELDFGNGRIHNVVTYQGAAYLMLRMEPGTVSVYDLPKRKKKKE